MPGLHNAKQKLLGFWCDLDFLAEIDKGRGQTARSQFMRDALVEKLARMNIHVAAEKTVAPDRTGKGGPKRRVTYPETSPAVIVVEDKVDPNSKAGALPPSVEDADVAKAKREAQEAARKQQAGGSSGGKSSPKRGAR